MADEWPPRGRTGSSQTARMRRPIGSSARSAFAPGRLEAPQGQRRDRRDVSNELLATCSPRVPQPNREKTHDQLDHAPCSPHHDFRRPAHQHSPGPDPEPYAAGSTFTPATVLDRKLDRLIRVRNEVNARSPRCSRGLRRVALAHRHSYNHPVAPPLRIPGSFTVPRGPFVVNARCSSRDIRADANSDPAR